MSTCRLCVAVTICVALCPWAAQAQFGRPEPASQAISGVGAAVVKKTPTTMRMVVELSGTGKNLEEALKNLQDNKTAAAKKIEPLGVEKDSVKFGSPTQANAQNAQKAQMEQMIRQRMMMKGGKPGKGAQATPSVTVGATLTASWPLKGQTPEQLMIEAGAITEKVKAAKLTGQAEKRLSAAEEEAAEEMADMMRSSGEEVVQPGEPHFFFMAKIGSEEREKALADAFQKAKANAEQLAKAAGIQIGDLYSVSSYASGISAGFGEYDSPSPYGNYRQQQYRQQLMAQAIGEGGEELLAEQGRVSFGAEPKPLVFQFGIQAQFAIKPAK